MNSDLENKYIFDITLRCVCKNLIVICNNVVTNESYVTEQEVIVQMVMQNNKSRLIILDETTNENGAFSGVDGSVNLVDYFDF